MKIKICGITNLEDALYATECGANALGFIFYKKSKRYISPQNASLIISNLPPFVFSVGVFVNEFEETVNTISKEIKLNAVQLHGSENKNYIDKINLPVIKAFRINNNFIWDIINEYNCNLLLDSNIENEFGGTGVKFDWDLIPFKLRSKIILAGGIDESSLPKIITKIKPAAIDLSSSLEDFPGKKNHLKMKRFFEIYNDLIKGNKNV